MIIYPQWLHDEVAAYLRERKDRFEGMSRELDRPFVPTDQHGSTVVVTLPASFQRKGDPQ